MWMFLPAILQLLQSNGAVLIGKVNAACQIRSPSYDGLTDRMLP